METIKACAKINIGLRVLGKRDDGFHEIETVFHRVNPCDEIVLIPSDTITFKCTDPELPADERNLSLRAAGLLKKLSGTKRGAEIFLKKNIPVGAGLGGGSSDAASTLLGLARLWDLNIRKDDLHLLALQLGSDVPYFLGEGSAYARGRGDILEYFNLPVPHWILVVYPGIKISTAWAYGQINEEHKHKPPEPSGQLRESILAHMHHPEDLARYIFNDFEPVVLHQNEIMRFCKISLYAAGAKFAQMSGSGSAFYGFFTDRAAVFTAAEIFSKKYRVCIAPPAA